MTEHHKAIRGPKVEVSNPQLRVDHRKQPLHLSLAALRHLQFERASQVQRLDVEHPGKGNLIVGPFSAHHNCELVFACTLERPLVSGRHTLDYFERISTTNVNVNNGHSCHRDFAHGCRPKLVAQYDDARSRIWVRARIHDQRPPQCRAPKAPTTIGGHPLAHASLGWFFWTSPALQPADLRN